MTLTTRLTLMVLFCLAVLALAPFAGLGGIDDAAIREHILTQIRLPRALFAFVAGAGLALCGLVFQAMFHNPLATPFTLGVASGASFGAALTVLLGINISLLGLDAITLGAFVGALGAISFVYGISRLNYSFSTETLLLTGVATSFFFSSLILFTQYLSDVNESFRITRWLMGGLSISGYQQLLQLLPVVTLSAGIIIWLSRELNLLMAGDNIAISRGVAVKRVRYLMFFTTSMCVGAIVALCGPIGFVGMMVPHICRLIIGTDHRWLIPASLVFGGGFLILCDTLARTIIAPAELPVGVITTLLGGPFFLWLLVRHRRQTP